VLTRAEADGLTRVAHAAGTTVFNLLFAACSVVLHRYSGQHEILVGTPVRARTLPEVENIIGPFINAVVLRTQVDPDEPFSSYLARVKDTTLDALSNQEMPLELLGTRPPVVRAFFSYQDARGRPLYLGDTKLTQFNAEPPAAGVDLMLWFMERPHELVVVANFSTELFETRTIERLLQNFLTLLRDVAQHPARPVGSLALLTDEQRALEAAASEATPPVEHPSSWVYAPLLTRAAATPQAVAFDLDGTSLTYEQLSSRARGLSGGIRRRSPAGGTVAILAVNATDLLSALYGTWISGCTALLLDPRDPDAYLRRVLDAAAPALILVDEAQRSRACFSGAAPLATVAEATDRDAPAPSTDPPSSTQLAWVQAYFGSDGKLVQSGLTHAELSVRVAALAAQASTSARSFLALLDVAGETLPLSVLLGVQLGAKAFLALEEETLEGALKRALGEPGEVVALLRTSVLTPGLLGSNAKDRLTVLAYGRVGAELSLVLTRSARRAVAMFGAEAVLLTHELSADAASSVVGRPLGLSSMRVLDPLGKGLPVSVVGELVAGTLEAEHTGLFGRLTSQGEFDLVRADGPALIAGRRFDASEVARVLSQHAAIARAFVRVVGYPAASESVVAYFQVKPGVSYTDAELRRLVRSSLPGAVVPQVLLELAELPLSADGSVDIDRLPEPFSGSAADDFVAPRNETERVVAELYGEALGLPSVGIYDNFFDLGGHSLLCFRVIARIEERLGKRLSPRSILLNTLEQVANELGSGAKSPSAATPSASAARPSPSAGADPSLTGRVLKKFQGFFKR
jgi:non-ribosomal peptide synthetase component F